MDPSTNNTVNLYPERRAKMKSSQDDQTATSPYFEPSQASHKQASPGDTDFDDFFAKPLRRNDRQTAPSFTSNGQLGNKQRLANPTPRTDTRRQKLSEVAAETISLLPGLLATRPDVGKEGHLHTSTAISPLDPTDPHPHLPPTSIRVLDADTIDAALTLLTKPSTTTNPNPNRTKPPLLLNMANATHAGGGFKHGALAQEEALCYRSSLIFTLKLRHYPLPPLSALYSPKILIIRSSLSSGHGLLDLRHPANLPVLSVISVAAVCLPARKTTFPSGSKQKEMYANPHDRDLMREKMRTILRVAAREGHTQLVLGALGCGAFRNPSWEVAELWKSVLCEREFGGGRWEDVVFAVMGAGTENFGVFEETLGGLRV